MKRSQTGPEQWLIVNVPPDAALWRAIGHLPRKSGVLLLTDLRPNDRRRLRHLASLRQLAIVAEAPRTSVRVHDISELTQALTRRPVLLLISPLWPTGTHPGCRPLPRMRAATLARLTGLRAIALGGMDRRRYAKVAPLGFIAWAGISAFRT